MDDEPITFRDIKVTFRPDNDGFSKISLLKTAFDNGSHPSTKIHLSICKHTGDDTRFYFSQLRSTDGGPITVNVARKLLGIPDNVKDRDEYTFGPVTNYQMGQVVNMARNIASAQHYAHENRSIRADITTAPCPKFM